MYSAQDLHRKLLFSGSGKEKSCFLDYKAAHHISVLMPLHNWEVLLQIPSSTSAGACPAWQSSATVVMETIQYSTLELQIYMLKTRLYVTKHVMYIQTI